MKRPTITTPLPNTANPVAPSVGRAPRTKVSKAGDLAPAKPRKEFDKDGLAPKTPRELVDIAFPAGAIYATQDNLQAKLELLATSIAEQAGETDMQQLALQALQATQNSAAGVLTMEGKRVFLEAIMLGFGRDISRENVENMTAEDAAVASKVNDVFGDLGGLGDMLDDII